MASPQDLSHFSETTLHANFLFMVTHFGVVCFLAILISQWNWLYSFSS